jgi:hypothetical protein
MSDREIKTSIGFNPENGDVVRRYVENGVVTLSETRPLTNRELGDILTRGAPIQIEIDGLWDALTEEQIREIRDYFARGAEG